MGPGQQRCSCHGSASLATVGGVLIDPLTSMCALTPLIPKEDVPAVQYLYYVILFSCSASLQNVKTFPRERCILQY